jgi:hypothetical protein
MKFIAIVLNYLLFGSVFAQINGLELSSLYQANMNFDLIIRNSFVELKFPYIETSFIKGNKNSALNSFSRFPIDAKSTPESICALLFKTKSRAVYYQIKTTKNTVTTAYAELDANNLPKVNFASTSNSIYELIVCDNTTIKDFISNSIAHDPTNPFEIKEIPPSNVVASIKELQKNINPPISLKNTTTPDINKINTPHDDRLAALKIYQKNGYWVDGKTNTKLLLNPKKVKAIYKSPFDKKVIVFVDDSGSTFSIRKELNASAKFIADFYKDTKSITVEILDMPTGDSMKAAWEAAEDIDVAKVYVLSDGFWEEWNNNRNRSAINWADMYSITLFLHLIKDIDDKIASKNLIYNRSKDTTERIYLNREISKLKDKKEEYQDDVDLLINKIKDSSSLDDCVREQLLHKDKIQHFTFIVDTKESVDSANEVVVFQKLIAPKLYLDNEYFYTSQKTRKKYEAARREFNHLYKLYLE